MLNPDICDRARLARDARFDGQFFIGVTSTGIYCRPICPVVPPKRQNVRYFPTAAAAAEAGFRPCLRCRPECAPGTPAWNGTSTTVRRGLRLIASGALDEGGVEMLAERLGVTSRHLRRLFHKHLGASPLAVAHTQRLHFAKRLIDDTHLPMSHIAIAAGYGSVRRFNDAFLKTYGRSPRELRRARRSNGARPAGNGAALTFRLPFREPFDWHALLAFFRPRATPGVEHVDGNSYRRVVSVDGRHGVLEVAPAEKAGFLVLTLHGARTESLFELIQRTRDVFDLDAPVAEIMDVLSRDPVLRRALDAHPGIRVPGAWSGFELTVRAVLGQQVSVKAATTLAGRVAARYGEPLALAADVPAAQGLTHAFPSPERLRRARFNGIGMVQSRADTIRRVAAAVLAGDLRFDGTQDADTLCRALCSIRGIGDWTAQYVAMRALRYPDAWPAGDLGLQKALDPPRRVPAAELAARAEQWRPWRAYAAMLLWSSLPGGGG
ncbi:MAG TPA: AlkA N-terminal domain-containing protein [Woeseiaceae bacterium]|nr:AlkA N-terminal domain-containing protein [Woeseiaceae bacterium]